MKNISKILMSASSTPSVTPSPSPPLLMSPVRSVSQNEDQCSNTSEQNTTNAFVVSSNFGLHPSRDHHHSDQHGTHIGTYQQPSWKQNSATALHHPHHHRQYGSSSSSSSNNNHTGVVVPIDEFKQAVPFRVGISVASGDELILHHSATTNSSSNGVSAKMSPSSPKAPLAQWQADCPDPRFAHTMSLVVEKTSCYLLLCGGSEGANFYLEDSYLYDIDCRIWTQLPNVGPRAFHTACPDSTHEKVYVFGGRNAVHGDLDDLLVFNIQTKKWSALETDGLKPSARSSHCACFCLGDNCMYVFGGARLAREDDDSHPLDDMWKFDTSTHEWSRVSYTGQMPGLVGQRACFANDLIYVFGGNDSSCVPNSNALHAFDPATQRWHQVEVPTVRGLRPSPRQHYSMAVFNDNILLLGGVNQNDIPLRDLWCMNIKGREGWFRPETQGDPPCARSLHDCVLCEDRLYVFGGTNDDSPATVFNTLHTLQWPSFLQGKSISELKELLNRQLLSTEDEHVLIVCAEIGQRIAKIEESFANQQKRVEKMLGRTQRRVTLNVGGTLFETTTGTLNSCENMMSAMLRGPWKEEAKEFFIDRDPIHFRLILNFLRDGACRIPTSAEERRELRREANFYQLNDLVKLLT